MNDRPDRRRAWRGRALAVSLVGLALAFSAGGATAGGAHVGAASAEKITIVYTSPASAFLPWRVAKDAGIFEKHGLDATIFLAVGPLSNAAVISGSAQISLDGATPVATAIGRGAPLAIIGAFINRLSLVAVGDMSIAKPADLRGKKIATNAPGSIGDVATRMMLKDAGLDPNRDTQIQYIANLNDRITSMLAGRVDAIITSPPIHALTDTGRYHQFFSFRGYRQILSGMSARRDWATANQETLKKVFRSYVDAAKFIHNPANRADVLKSLSTLTGLTSAQDLNEGLAFEIQDVQYEPVPNLTSLKNSIQVARDTQGVDISLNDVIYLKPLAEALTYDVAGELTAAQQVPRPKGVGGAARGELTGRLSSDGTFQWKLTFAGLSGQAALAAIHVGRPGNAGPARVRLCSPCRSGQTGTVKLYSGVTQALKFTRGGGAYVAIATRANRGGEVRGTLTATFAD